MDTVESCGGKFTILSLDDALKDELTIRAWREYARYSDVYFDLNYLRLEATRFGSSVYLSTFVLGNELVLRTHLVRPIGTYANTRGRYVDMITPFEFGGPISLPFGRPPSKKLIKLAQDAMDNIAQNRGSYQSLCVSILYFRIASTGQNITNFEKLEIITLLISTWRRRK